MQKLDTTVIAAQLQHLEEVVVSDPRGHVPASLRDLRDIYRQMLSLVEVVNQLEANITTALIMASSLKPAMAVGPIPRTF